MFSNFLERWNSLELDQSMSSPESTNANYCDRQRFHVGTFPIDYRTSKLLKTGPFVEGLVEGFCNIVGIDALRNVGSRSLIPHASANFTSK